MGVAYGHLSASAKYRTFEDKMILNTQKAVKLAKQWLATQLSEEGIANIGLEEIRWVDDCWEITLGFNRPWDFSGMLFADVGAKPRTYKIIKVRDSDQSIVEMRNREAA